MDGMTQRRVGETRRQISARRACVGSGLLEESGLYPEAIMPT